jgi:DMSO/TMAO reductase YedYZ molybdopterin-dependent catalytic subunit
MKCSLLSIALVSCLSSAVMTGPLRAAEGSAPLVVIDGLVKHSLHVSAEDLRGMPTVRREVSFLTDHGEQKATYVGVLLWDVVQRSGIDDTAKWGELRHVMAVTGKDGYLVMLSFGEIDPNFGNAPIMIAYERNGQPLEAGGLRLVVPGDRHGARDVRDLVRVEVR